MNNLQFIAALVASLAWPGTVVIMALAFRRPLLGLLEKVRQFEGLGLKADFGDRVEKLADDAAKAGLLQTPDNAPHPAREPSSPPAPSSISEPAPSSARRKAVFYGGGPAYTPADLILTGWAKIERALIHTATVHGIPTMTGSSAAKRLLSLGKMRPDTYALVNEARELRNSLAHTEGGIPNVGKAILYESTARSIAEAILRDAGLDELDED